uniref:C2H2-type domain-containing protein n=1 Tax=Romanomermis culicivorax TaxID=13658 RepID=A0A915L6Z8_ROMCU
MDFHNVENSIKIKLIERTENLLPENIDQQQKDDNPAILVLDEDAEIAERNSHIMLGQRNLHVPHTPEFDDNVNVDENILLDYSLEPHHAASTPACDSCQTTTNIGKTATSADNASSTGEPVCESQSTPLKPVDFTGTVERAQAVNFQQTEILKDQNIESLPQATMTSATIIYNEINGDSEIQIEEIVKAKSGDQVNDKCDPQITVIDDDIQIVDNDTEADATRSLTVNKQNHFCQVCNRGFRTGRAVQEHMSSHIFDAGATCEQTFGVPLRHIVYVCRSCCLAYEDSDVFAKHIKKHGPIFGCPRCTAVSFDQTQMQLHEEAHNNGKLVFGCVTCRIAFRKEQNLLLHMNRMHEMNILWICLKCFMANTDWATMYSHVMTQHYSAYPVHPAKVLVPCATAKLHYQPIKPVEYESSLSLLTPAVRRLTAPAECPHRTFNTYNETLVACPVCGSMIAATRYLLENEDLRKVGQFKLLLVDEAQEKIEQDLHPACVNKTTVHPNLNSAITIDDRVAPPNITIANALPRASLPIQNVGMPCKKTFWLKMRSAVRVKCTSNATFISVTPATTATSSQRPILTPTMSEISRLLSSNNNNNNTAIAPGNQQLHLASQPMPHYRPRRLNVLTASKPLAAVAPSVPLISAQSRTSTPSIVPPGTNRSRASRPFSNVATQNRVGPAPIQSTNASITCSICNVIVQNQLKCDILHPPSACPVEHLWKHVWDDSRVWILQLLLYTLIFTPSETLLRSEGCLGAELTANKIFNQFIPTIIVHELNQWFKGTFGYWRANPKEPVLVDMVLLANKK